ncbi:hypothetical protein ADL27_42285, partial [Streptomyces sp. NRRL F-6602]
PFTQPLAELAEPGIAGVAIAAAVRGEDFVDLVAGCSRMEDEPGGQFEGDGLPVALNLAAGPGEGDRTEDPHDRVGVRNRYCGLWLRQAHTDPRQGGGGRHRSGGRHALARLRESDGRGREGRFAIRTLLT